MTDKTDNKNASIERGRGTSWHASDADKSARQFAPATDRNTRDIIEILSTCLPSEGAVLEIASGTGQHVMAFADAFPDLSWHPSDPNPTLRGSIAAWRTQSGLGNIKDPRDLDMCAPNWWGEIKTPIAAILAINLIHISPWAASLGLMKGAGTLLEENGLLYCYGPYKRDNQHTSASNEAFDESLRSRNAEWGVRDVDEVVEVAARESLRLEDIIPMPANNLSLIFRKSD